MSEPLTAAQKGALTDWFSRCEDRTDSGHLPSVWLEELQEIVAGLLASAERHGEEKA